MSKDLKNNKKLIEALEFFININGWDSETNTPDFILAEYLYSKLLISIEELRSNLEEKNKPIARGNYE